MTRILLLLGGVATLFRDIGAQESRRDSVELSVLQVAIGPIALRDSAPFPTRADLQRFCGVSRRCTYPDSLRTAFAAALDDLDIRNQVASDFPAGAARLLSGPRFVPTDSCLNGPTELSVSRVGLDSLYETAVVVYAAWTGRGSYPGCGVGGGATLFLRRSREGIWRVVARAGGWIT